LADEASILESHGEMMDPNVFDNTSAKAMHYDEFRKRQSQRRPT
jgi:hypothetical protein